MFTCSNIHCESYIYQEMKKDNSAYVFVLLQINSYENIIDIMLKSSQV